MATNPRVCERVGCENSIAELSKSARFCSAACKQKAHRESKQLTEILDDETKRPHVRKEIAKEVAKVIQPVVRQAVTEEVMQSIQKLVGLTPLAIEALQDDLLGEDPKLRQTAYNTALKYTVGHSALVTSEDTDNSQIVVNFNLPRPNAAEARTEPLSPDEIEMRQCDICEEVKPSTEFEGTSYRCHACFADRKRAILAQYGS